MPSLSNLLTRRVIVNCRASGLTAKHARHLFPVKFGAMFAIQIFSRSELPLKIRQLVGVSYFLDVLIVEMVLISCSNCSKL
jgi:hypothetical protein